MSNRIKTGDVLNNIRYGDMLFVVSKIVREYERNLAYVEYIDENILVHSYILLNDDLSVSIEYRKIEV